MVNPRTHIRQSTVRITSAELIILPSGVDPEPITVTISIHDSRLFVHFSGSGAPDRVRTGQITTNTVEVHFKEQTEPKPQKQNKRKGQKRTS